VGPELVEGQIEERQRHRPGARSYRPGTWPVAGPALVFFLFAERRIVGGLSGAVKG